jgi:crotonobetainyl-CoA:carnitine CoA-transferase CaiB-like acyl-CoA transferase
VVTVGNGDAVAIAGHPAAKGNFESYIGLIGRPELADDPRFTSVAARQEHLADLHGEIAAYAATVADAETLEVQCAQFRLAVGAVRSVAEVCDSDWARERDAVAEVDDRGGGRLRIPNAPWKFSDAPAVGVGGAPRYRGEDNGEVLREVLAMSDASIAELTEAGVLSSHGPR